jgi:eukaryotic-like serine/threonine-protein kinase
MGIMAPRSKIFAKVLVLAILLMYVALFKAAQAVPAGVEDAGLDGSIFIPVIYNTPALTPMVLIHAGSFEMGCDPAHNGGYPCNTVELPLHSAALDTYLIEVYEVTNAQYAVCVAAGACAAPIFSSYYGNEEFENEPVTPDTWYDTAGYCAWAGRRLPTEAEWEKAARGASDTRAYPWGDLTPDCSMANFRPNQVFCIGKPTIVGRYPSGASPYGVMDMAGNVQEWVSDWFDETYYSSQTDWNNPTGPASGDRKVLRGGSWGYIDDGIRVALREHLFPVPPSEGGYGVGFRCAKRPGS